MQQPTIRDEDDDCRDDSRKVFDGIGDKIWHVERRRGQRRGLASSAARRRRLFSRARAACDAETDDPLTKRSCVPAWAGAGRAVLV